MALLWVTAAIMLLLAFMPIGIIFDFLDGKVSLLAKIGIFKFTVYPRPKKDKLRPKAKKKDASKPKSNLGLIDYFKLAASLNGQLRAKLAINKLKLYALIADEDPYQTALKQGKTCIMITNALAIIDTAFKIKKREIFICPDFLAEKSRISCQLDISLKFYQIITLGSSFLIQFWQTKRQHRLKVERGI